MIVTCSECGSDNEVEGQLAWCSRCDSPLRASRQPKPQAERDMVAQDDAPAKKKTARYWIIGFIIGLKLLFVFVRFLGLDNGPPPPQPPQEIMAVPNPNMPGPAPEVLIRSFELFEPSELLRDPNGRRHFRIKFNRLKPLFMQQLPILRIEMGLKHQSLFLGPRLLLTGEGPGKIDFTLADEEIPPGTKELVVWLEYDPHANIPPRAGRVESNEVRLRLNPR